MPSAQQARRPSRSASSPATWPRRSLRSLKSSRSATTTAKPDSGAAAIEQRGAVLVEAAVVRQARERVGERLELLALEGAQALQRHRGVRDQERRVVDDLGRERRLAAVCRAGSRAFPSRCAAAGPGGSPRGRRAVRRRRPRPARQARALERVLARALVAHPGLRQHELALDDLPDLHAGEPERAPDRTRDHAQHRAVLARLGEPREGLPEPAPAGRLARLGRLAAERVPQHRRGAPQRRGMRARRRARRPGGPPIPSRRAAPRTRTARRARAARRSSRGPVARTARTRRRAEPTPQPAPRGGGTGART